MSDAWDTDLGRWAQECWEYARLRSGSPPTLRQIPPDADPFAPDPRAKLPSPDPSDADAVFQREIALAHEVCDEQVAADAATAFVPDVPLPFGGEGAV